jgi:hypothetical protein
MDTSLVGSLPPSSETVCQTELQAPGGAAGVLYSLYVCDV